MRVDYPTCDAPATVEYVLAVIQDHHRLQCHYDSSADPDENLALETTIAEWNDACGNDFPSWRATGRGLNEWWNIDCSDDEWRAALTPYHKKRLLDVCALIADKATRQTVRPAQLFGRTCEEAGAFLTIRSLLAQAGADAHNINPSTPLAPYARRYLATFLGPIARLAPGKLPPTKISRPLHSAFCGIFVAGWLGLLAGCFTGWPYVTIAGVLLVAIGFPMTWIAAQSLPKSVSIGSLNTFRDLAMTLATQDPQAAAS